MVGSEGPNVAQWQQPELYRQFLVDVCTHIGDHPGLLAYDLFNEPGWHHPWLGGMNKLLTAHWIADSYWTIKSVSPNQLVTIGLTHPDAIGTWDPALIPVDFVSYHYYADTLDKIDVQVFRRCIATLAVTGYVLADMPGSLLDK